jgi:hypothetical protein
LNLKKDIYSNFSKRLEQALETKVIRNSPTVLANLFNSKFGGKSVTPHTARNWMLGKSLPTQDKLVCLAELLGTSSEYLRFGTNNNRTFVISQTDGTSNELTDQQQQFVRRYLKLNIVQQKLISELVEELKS